MDNESLLVELGRAWRDDETRLSAVRGDNPMNDIFTATNAMDWLAAGLANLAARKIPEATRRDAHGHLRVIARPRTFEEVAAKIFDQLRPYAASDPHAALHLMGTLADVAGQTENRERRAVLLTHAKALRHAALTKLDQPRDVEAIEAAYGAAVAALSAPRLGEAPVVTSRPNETPSGDPSPTETA